MSKIICDVCGTSYPETSAQCPICGCVHPVDIQNVIADKDENLPASPYQHVKGGRFSKANVRKRAANPQPTARESSPQSHQEPKQDKQKKSGNTGLVITVFVLLIAIVIAIGYIAIKVVGNFGGESTEVKQPAIVEQDPTDTSELEIRCQQVTLDNAQYALKEIGQKMSIKATLMPADTTEEISYISDNQAVAAVDQLGVITAVGYGEATITVTCGTISSQCQVTVAPDFVLDTDAIILESVGQTYEIYSGPIALADIVWKTDDAAVASVKDGIVTAVSAGETTVYGECGGVTVSCSVECFIEEEVIETQAPTEAPVVEETQAPAAGGAAGPFTLKNLYGGRSDDVTLAVGDSFKLVLLDASGNVVEGVTWTVSGGSSKVSEGVVTAVASGYSEVTATYNGETFVCKIRVR